MFCEYLNPSEKRSEDTFTDRNRVLHTVGSYGGCVATHLKSSTQEAEKVDLWDF